MSAEDNKAVVRRFIEEVINQGRLDLIATLFAPALHDQVRGIQMEIRASFADVHETIEDLVAEGDTVMARWTFRGTHRGDFYFIPATGRQVEVIGFAVYYLKDGQIVEDHAVIDWLEAIEQLGGEIVPPPSG